MTDGRISCIPRRQKGAKSPEMNVLDWHRPQVTIFSGLLASVAPSLTTHNLTWKTAVTSLIAKSYDAWAS